MRERGILLSLSVSLLLGAPVGTFAEGWRLFGGSVDTDWRVLHPPRGHKEDCPTRACDDRDLREGNLDRSIGYRAGAERPLLAAGRWELFAGGELASVFTEYNSSQRDVRISEAFAVAGGRVGFGRLALLTRVGGGACSFDDGRGGLSRFLEGAAEVRIGSKAGIRFAARRARHGKPRSNDYSILLVDFGGPPSEGGPWSFGWSIGLSDPGGGAGESLALSAAPFSRITVSRALRGRPDRFSLSFQMTAHESEKESVFLGTAGNERGKTIHGLGLTWRREAALSRAFAWRYGLGLEVSNWEDEHSLLLNEAGKPVVTGYRAGLLGGLEMVLAVRPGLRFLLGVEKAYWGSLGLGEIRSRIGVEISP